MDHLLLVLVLATTGYVVIAVLDRPRWSWPVLAVLVVPMLALGAYVARPAAIEEQLTVPGH